MSQIHQNIIQIAVAYTLLGALIFTVVATCLSLVGIVNFKYPNQQKALFYALIIELMIIATTFFGGLLKFDPREVSIQAEKAVLQASKEKGVVYIQVPDQNAEKEAKKLQSFLTDKGYVAPEIEVVGSKRSPQSSQIRYFYKSQAGRAEGLRNEMNSLGFSDFKVEYIKDFEGKVSPDVLEVWYKS